MPGNPSPRTRRTGTSLGSEPTAASDGSRLGTNKPVFTPPPSGIGKAAPVPATPRTAQTPGRERPLVLPIGRKIRQSHFAQLLLPLPQNRHPGHRGTNIPCPKTKSCPRWAPAEAASRAGVCVRAPPGLSGTDQGRPCRDPAAGTKMPGAALQARMSAHGPFQTITASDRAITCVNDLPSQPSSAAAAVPDGRVVHAASGPAHTHPEPLHSRGF